MNLRLSAMLFLLVQLFLGCGPERIRKVPVPREHQIRAIRLVAEGDKLAKAGKDHLAMLKYLEASELNPYFEVIFNKLAVTYLRLQMFYQARRAVNRALALKKDYSYAYNTKGVIDLANQNAKAAEKSFKKAIDLEPGVPNFYINYGYTLIQMEKPDEAMRAYRKALELDPGIFSEGRDFVELEISSEEGVSAEKYYQMSQVFAQLGNLTYCLRYLGKAFAGGFHDSDRIKSDPAFEQFREKEEFVRFLQLHGFFL